MLVARGREGRGGELSNMQTTWPKEALKVIYTPTQCVSAFSFTPYPVETIPASSGFRFTCLWHPCTRLMIKRNRLTVSTRQGRPSVGALFQVHKIKTESLYVSLGQPLWLEKRRMSILSVQLPQPTCQFSNFTIFRKLTRSACCVLSLQLYSVLSLCIKKARL